MLKFLKGLFKSRTVWLNATTIVGFLTALMNSEIIAENPELSAVIGGVIAFLNLYLRVNRRPVPELGEKLY